MRDKLAKCLGMCLNFTIYLCDFSRELANYLRFLIHYNMHISLLIAFVCMLYIAKREMAQRGNKRDVSPLS